MAELWPEGWMANNGIKAAVMRSKERVEAPQQVEQSNKSLALPMVHDVVSCP